MKLMLLPVLATALLPLGSSHAAPPPAAEPVCLIAGWENPASVCVSHTRTIAATCYICHGQGGFSKVAVPSIAGLEKDYFVAALKDFRDGKRESTVMKRYAMGYSESEYEALAEFFAAQPTGSQK